MKIYTKDMIKEKIEKKKRRKAIINFLLTPIIVILLVICIFAVYQKIVLKKQNIEILGFKGYIVMTGSMEPSINAGDVIIGKKANENNIKIGDVITFSSINSGATITHRIVDITNKDGKRYYQTKGDNNNSEDVDLVEYKDIQGIVLFKIGKIGKILLQLLTGTGVAFVFFILAIFYHFASQREDRMLAREEARRRYNICRYKKEEQV